MDINVLVGLVGVGALIVGAFGGALLFKFKSKRNDKQEIKNALEVLEGKRKNVIVVEGKEYEARKFVMRDEDDNEIIIDLQEGGITTPHGKKENKEVSKDIREGYEEVIDSPPVREDSISPGKKKRNLRGRLRRFG